MQLDVSPSWYPLAFRETQYYFHAAGHHLLAFRETQFKYYATGCPPHLGTLKLFVKLYKFHANGCPPVLAQFN
jgi:hypothetical protein